MFFRTILREWAGLDYLRVDKFLKLVRIFTQHIFDYLQQVRGICASCKFFQLLSSQAQWDPDLTRSFVSCLREEVLTKTPNGLRLHVADVFLPELCAAASSSIDTRTLLELLQPFLEACSKGTDEALQKRITKNILREFATSYARELPRTAEAPRFVNVDTKQLQAKIFAVATHATTKNKFRSALHYVHKYFQEVTRVKLAHLAEEPADTIAREDSRNEDSTAVAPPTDMFETKVKLLEPRVETPSTFQPAHQSAEHATLLKRKKKRAKIEKGTMQTVTDVAHASTTDPAQVRRASGECAFRS
jgi:ribosomal RNA-processing protein 1